MSAEAILGTLPASEIIHSTEGLRVERDAWINQGNGGLRVNAGAGKTLDSLFAEYDHPVRPIVAIVIQSTIEGQVELGDGIEVGVHSFDFNREALYVDPICVMTSRYEAIDLYPEERNDIQKKWTESHLRKGTGIVKLANGVWEVFGANDRILRRRRPSE